MHQWQFHSITVCRHIVHGHCNCLYFAQLYRYFAKYQKACSSFQIVEMFGICPRLGILCHFQKHTWLLESNCHLLLFLWDSFNSPHFCLLRSFSYFCGGYPLAYRHISNYKYSVVYEFFQAYKVLHVTYG